jgi:integrase
MASFRFHGNRWQARVRRAGYPVQTRSFLTKADAERWARTVEVQIDRGTYETPTIAQQVSLGDLIDRYMREVTPRMKGAKEDLIRLAAIRRREICSIKIKSLTASRVASYRDERLQQVSAGTVIRELAYLSAIINHARRDWGIQASNPVAMVKKPPSPKGRDRIMDLEELERLFRFLKPTARRSALMLPLVKFALETAMRRGEILSLRWDHIDLPRRTAFLPDTKNGHSRTVPLSSTAAAILQNLPSSVDGRVFSMSACAVSAAFSRAAERAGIQEVRFHDLRHIAITRIAQKLPNLIELAAVSGHKNVAMLKRYYHPNAAELAIKLG